MVPRNTTTTSTNTTNYCRALSALQPSAQRARDWIPSIHRTFDTHGILEVGMILPVVSYTDHLLII